MVRLARGVVTAREVAAALALGRSRPSSGTPRHAEGRRPKSGCTPRPNRWVYKDFQVEGLIGEHVYAQPHPPVQQISRARWRTVSVALQGQSNDSALTIDRLFNTATGFCHYVRIDRCNRVGQTPCCHGSDGALINPHVFAPLSCCSTATQIALHAKDNGRKNVCRPPRDRSGQYIAHYRSRRQEA